MTGCAYHPEVEAPFACEDCAYPLCTGCHREAMGRIFCAECLEARLAPAAQPVVEPPPLAGPPPLPSGPPFVRKTPWLALVLSMVVPGLGQVYNGLWRRGVLQFLAWWVLLWMLKRPPLGALFTLLMFGAWTALWIWQFMDAHGTACAINRLGRVPSESDPGVSPMTGAVLGARGDAPPLGIALVVIGFILFLQEFADTLGRVMQFAWPFAMIAVGAAILVRARRRAASVAVSTDGLEAEG